MPTTTAVGTNIVGGDYLVLTSLGPLTSTFTAPESCGPTPDVLSAAVRVRDGRTWPIYTVGANCGPSIEPENLECLPSSDAMSRVVADNAAVLTVEMIQPYFSPAHDCPAGWTTAGVAAMSNGTASASGGAFLPTPTYTDSNFAANMLIEMLGPEETAVYCCPSGYSKNPFDENCYIDQPVSTIVGETACAVYYTVGLEDFDDVDYTGPSGSTYMPSFTEFPLPSSSLSSQSDWFRQEGVPGSVFSSVIASLYPQESYSYREFWSTVTTTWVVGTETYTRTDHVEIEPAITETPAESDMGTWTVTLGDDMTLTPAGDDAGVTSGAGGSPFHPLGIWQYLIEDVDSNFTAAGVVPAVLLIHGGEEGGDGSGDGDGDEQPAAGVSNAINMWTVGGALAAGLVAVAAL